MAKEATMHTLNASWNFISGLAVQLGVRPETLPKHSQTRLRKAATVRRNAVNQRRLNKVEKQELAESIRHDDWFE
jgi:hypothetical protein